MTDSGQQEVKERFAGNLGQVSSLTLKAEMYQSPCDIEGS